MSTATIATPTTLPPAEPTRERPSWPRPGYVPTDDADAIRTAARRGTAALYDHATNTAAPLSAPDAFADLLADLMHAADALGIDAGHAWDRARQAYTADRNPTA